MPRKGRLVQPRHIFPWIAAPYIEMLRILWRIERLFFLPIRYLQAWTVSAICGVIGVLFSVALFIPRLTETTVQASPGSDRRPLISRYDMPFIAEEDLALPQGYAASPAHLSVRMQRTHVEDFDQEFLVKTQSGAYTPKRSLVANRGGWARHLLQREEEADTVEPLPSYVRQARVWDQNQLPNIPEYTYQPGPAGSYSLEKTPTLLISKSVPQVMSPDEPLTYIITVTNNGDEAVESAIVQETVSDMRRVIDCNPPAMVTPDYGSLIWNLAEIRPRETRKLQVTVQPDKRHTLVQETLVSFSSAPVIGEIEVRDTDRQPAPVQQPQPVRQPQPVQQEPEPRPAVVRRPKLVVEFDPPSATLQVGQEVEAYYTITNVGNADATHIRLLVEVPPQLRHRFGEMVEHKISRLAPQESRRALFAALAEGSGRMSLSWTLEADDLNQQSDSEWLAVLPGPTPQIVAPAPTPLIGKTPTPVRSSIPSREPTPLGSESLSAPMESLTNDPARPRAPRSSIPATTTPTPVTGPSSIPGSVDPFPHRSPNVGDNLKSSTPIDPELMPEEEPVFNQGVTPPDDLLPGNTESPAAFPTLPPEELPALDPPALEPTTLDGVKAQ